MSYPGLFQPVNIGKVRIKNRIAMAPMGIVGLTDADGNPNQRGIDYYIERARGGVGLIITGLFQVHDETGNRGGPRHMINRASTEPFGRICKGVHALGAKLFVQLTAGFGRVIPLPGHLHHPVSASAVPHFYNPEVTCRALETEEVEEIVAAFGPATDTLLAAGIDGIELHAHEGYLFDQFTTSIWNRRTDKYGGDLKQRLTFPLEVLEVIKERAGADFPVQYRFGLKHYIKGLNSGALPGEPYQEAGRDIEEGLEMAKLLEEAGFDSLHVDAGCYDSWYWAHPPGYQAHGCMTDMAEKVKKVVKIPVIAVGRLEVPELAERVIVEGKADMVAIGRGLLADPDWPLKVYEGREEDIRPCIGCHEGCIWRFMKGESLSCAVNPACGKEREYQLNKADVPKKVIVIGGGVAGMEAARVAAMRGHKVVLYEKEKDLGGHLIEASVPRFKKDLAALLDWYKNELNKLDIVVKTTIEISPEIISQGNPDAVIVATGSVPVIPDIPGIDNPSVITCTDLMLGRKKAKDKVVVIGGGMVGCETAIWLAEQGKQVTLVEMLPELMAGFLSVPLMNRMMLTDLLALHKVDVLTGISVNEITAEGINITVNNTQKTIKADTVVLAAGLKPDDTLSRELRGKVANLYNVGDCREPRNIMGAIWDGFEVGRAI
ncbi:MAG: FAD-dependent oxidoreductase [Dehalococcoidales bacterium]|nr:FAD-dependent oxidoreductase [Dehalococcoidales bacterium]